MQDYNGASFFFIFIRGVLITKHKTVVAGTSHRTGIFRLNSPQCLWELKQ